ncbi:DNA replication licensing factor Mcm3 [Anopheles ziemanni]|uniref:DNA replication licensing factor Mcm3 n=1 Tax=Anopheles coustani TaxID=139045 RepID=UPI002659ABB3|nr:DNA replication licensing factor Mcm3 [Anopheles coustani]XP_058175312.1 DNA replication licensing factor Mcm3 [Anopheles ziemanni]
MADEDQRLADIQHEYLNFLDDEEDQGTYTAHVRKMINDKSKRLVVNINDVRRKNPARAMSLLNSAFDEQLAFSRALKEYVSTIDPSYAKSQEDFYVAFEGSFGNKHVTPRSLTSRFLGNLVCVEGIVTKVSLIRPKVVKSVHYCPATKKVMERRYTDLTSFEAVPTSAVYPTKDDDGNLLETEFGLSVYKDHQTLSIQEMPEKAPAGQLPRSVDVVCDDDLVDRCKPGDRIQIVGNYRCLPGKQGGYTTGTFRTVLIANNISQLSKENSLNVTREEINMCKKLAKNNDIFELLSKSLAPSIHGHEYVKKAILCLLLGGIEKNLANGARLRGDVNVLLIGDPSVAKSQLLRYVLNTAPRAITTTGRGSSGVGLTAAVTTDQETGERRLEAGAMVLADRGVVCIDEFDKMSDIDRTAIHEVMEQGRVTISKAGIHASLNARCSVLAAANPVYGRYDQYKTPMENIGLQDSLLSRFDLLFVMLDVIDSDHDRMISDHVVRMHRYRNPKEQDGDVLPMGVSAVDMLSTISADSQDDKETPMYEKYDPLLHGSSRKRSDQILSMEFMRKYIHIAKCLKPKLTDAACAMISNEYSRLRSEDLMDSDVARTQPVTARTLETLIRLSTAHAKARMSRTVAEKDAQAAIELIQFAYFKKVLEKEKKKRRRAEEDHSDDEQDEDEDVENEESEKTDGQETARRSKRTRVDPTTADDSDHEEMLTSSPDRGDLTRRPSIATPARETSTAGAMDTADSEEGSAVAITDDRLKLFRQGVHMAFKQFRDQAVSLSRLTKHINENSGDEIFTAGEITAAVNQMTESNQIMVHDDMVFLI